MKKRFLSMLLAVVMVVTMLPAYSISSLAVTSGDFEYEVISFTEKTIQITGYTGYDLNLEIPSKIDGYTVTTIGGYAFAYTQVESITISNSVTTIGDYAFSCCQYLAKITIPNSVITIGDYAFSDCMMLKSITIPNSVTTIGDNAFFNCIELRGLSIPDSVITIGDFAFGWCQNLTNILIPDSVTIIGKGAFSNCDGLISITVDSNNKNYSNDEYGVLFNKDKTTLVKYPLGNAQSSYTIPDSVTTISDYAFAYSGFYEYMSLTNITIPDGVTTIGDCAFSNVKATGMTIPDGVTTIGIAAFEGTGLTNVKIPNGVTTISKSAFMNCTSLTSVTISNGVTTIGENAFLYCTNLTSVVIPNSVTSIDNNAFYLCDNLSDVYYNSSEEDWNKISIDSCNDALLNATIHFNYCFHNYNLVVTSPTCTEQGYTTYTCFECGDEYVSDYTSELGHDFEAEFTVEVIPYPGECGWQSRHCTRCDETIDGRAVHDDTHTMSDTWREGEHISLIGCAGYYYLDCLDCTYAIQKEDAMHSKEFWYEIKATCTTDGFGEWRCGVCEGSLSERTIYEATGHNLSDWQVATDPTCEENGLEIKYCTNCWDWIEEREVSALGHDYGDFVIDNEPTCTTAGSKSQHCSRCDSKANVTEIPAKGHNLEWFTLSVASCETDGVKHGYCSDCSYFEIETTTKLGHTESDWFIDVEPSITEEGSKHKECTTCGKVLKTEVIEKLDYILGDVNGDGKLTAIDARWALQYSANNRELTVEQAAAADANGDGKVTAIDARWILQASAGNRVL